MVGQREKYLIAISSVVGAIVSAVFNVFFSMVMAAKDLGASLFLLALGVFGAMAISFLTVEWIIRIDRRLP